MQLIPYLSPDACTMYTVLTVKVWYSLSYLFELLIFKRELRNKIPIKFAPPSAVFMLCPWSTSLSCMYFFFSQQIATQIAVLIAKVARLDCPRQWPELIPILLESVKGQDGLQQHRALLTFYHVTKTLASKRLAQDRRLFQDVSPQY